MSCIDTVGPLHVRRIVVAQGEFTRWVFLDQLGRWWSASVMTSPWRTSRHSILSWTSLVECVRHDGHFCHVRLGGLCFCGHTTRSWDSREVSRTRWHIGRTRSYIKKYKRWARTFENSCSMRGGVLFPFIMRLVAAFR